MRALLLHGVFLLMSLMALAYINELKGEARVYTREKSIAQNISIKVFGDDGEEWKVKGRELVSLGKELSLLEVLLESVSGYKVKANSITFFRDRNIGRLKGDVEIRGEAFFVKTESGEVDFNKNLIYGKEKVLVWKGRNFVEGVGFKAFLKPLKVIIGGVKTKHEI